MLVSSRCVALTCLVGRSGDLFKFGIYLLIFGFYLLVLGFDLLVLCFDLFVLCFDLFVFGFLAFHSYGVTPASGDITVLKTLLVLVIAFRVTLARRRFYWFCCPWIHRGLITNIFTHEGAHCVVARSIIYKMANANILPNLSGDFMSTSRGQPKYWRSINSNFYFLEKNKPWSRISMKNFLSFNLQTVSAYLDNGTKAFPHNNERLQSRNIH